MKQKKYLLLIAITVLLVACQQETPASSVASDIDNAVVDETIPTEISTSEESSVVPRKEYTPIFEEALCPFRLPDSQNEGDTVECGYLIVPENRADFESRDIRLAVAIFHPENGASEPDPVIYLSGGPGGSALEFIYLSFDVGMTPILETGRDLILFDQRGVGVSEPALDCPELMELGLELMDREYEGAELTEDEVYDLTLETILSCREKLDQVADLSAYNTLANAADVEDLRIALGYDQVNLYGGSYGTRLALEVMRDYPKGIRSVVLDSVYPPNVNLNLEMPKNYLRALNVLFDSCTADEVCNQAYPELRRTFFETVAELNENPVPTTFGHPGTGETIDALFTGDFLMGFMFRFLYHSEILPILPQIIYDARDGNFQMLAQIYSALLFQSDMMSHGMQFSTQCNEEMSFTSPEEYQSMLADYPEVAELFDDSLFGKMGFEMCSQWGAGEAAAPENEPVYSDIPTLVLSGEFDPITPPEWARKAAEPLSNSYVFEFPGTGHGASAKTLGGTDCGPQILLDFISDPATPPDSSCINEMGIEFATPTNFDAIELIPVEVPQYGIRTLVPKGWDQAAPDYYIAPDRTIELVFTNVQDQSRQSFLDRWEADAPIDEFEQNGMLWTIQSVHLADGFVATSPHSNGFYMVLVVTTPEQAAQVYEPILLPIVNAFLIDESLTDEAESKPDEASTGDVKLIAYESETFSISGVVPEGWAEVQPGIYMRGTSASDQTLVIQKSYLGITKEELVTALLPGLQLEALPDPSGELKTDAFTWEVYQINVSAPGVGTFVVDLALTELDGTPHLVILQAGAQEHKEQEMHEKIFLPMVEALASMN